MPTTRLDSVAPDIVRLLQSAGASGRAAGLAAARFALTAVGVREVAADDALRALEGSDSTPSLLELKRLVERHDKEYFQAQDKADEKATLASFSRARAISALVFALEANPIEACYESQAATDNLPGVRTVVQNALRSKGDRPGR